MSLKCLLGVKPALGLQQSSFYLINLSPSLVMHHVKSGVYTYKAYKSGHLWGWIHICIMQIFYRMQILIHIIFKILYNGHSKQIGAENIKRPRSICIGKNTLKVHTAKTQNTICGLRAGHWTLRSKGILIFCTSEIELNLKSL